MFDRLVIVLCLILFTGCTNISLTKGKYNTLPLVPLLVDHKRQLSQHIKIDYLGEHYDIIAASLLSPTEVRISILSLEGINLLDVSYDGHNVNVQYYLEKSIQIPPEVLLTNIQLVYWPIDKLRRQLPSNWTLNELSADNTYQRQLIIDGKVNSEVHYSTADIWSASVQLEHMVFGYKLSIRNL
ncbi:DUF3261 domain-containing protein [Microbulbifer sp. 2304DJ12-6]|uniref:DUF3261 domain-containing protein n=1 Tax=Microbulbifer sp. 2304DJ12-6 TaxID=3233340 RepID=UPI0039B08FBA